MREQELDLRLSQGTSPYHRTKGKGKGFHVHEAGDEFEFGHRKGKKGDRKGERKGDKNKWGKRQFNDQDAVGGGAAAPHA